MSARGYNPSRCFCLLTSQLVRQNFCRKRKLQVKLCMYAHKWSWFPCISFIKEMFQVRHAWRQPFSTNFVDWKLIKQTIKKYSVKTHCICHCLQLCPNLNRITTLQYLLLPDYQTLFCCKPLQSPGHHSLCTKTLRIRKMACEWNWRVIHKGCPQSIPRSFH